jgi:hypothetical protein
LLPVSGWLRGGAAAVLVLAGARVGVAPAERCPEVSMADVEAAAAGALGWLAANQGDDGRFTYLADESGRDLGGYSSVRHAGVLLSLEHAHAAGLDGAREVADRAWGWALGELVETGDGATALGEIDGSVRTGASALLVLAAVDGDVEGVPLDRLGRFLEGQVDDRGAVLARWDGTPVPGTYDRFFTGEVLWALSTLGSEVADDVGRYVPHRDEHEDVFPPVSDHWAAYAYADLGLDRLSADQRAHAERLAGLFGVQVRMESTRWAGGLQQAIRQGPAVGSGLATLGEGGAALLRLFGPEAPAGLAARVRCAAGMLVERQAADGGWYTDGTTRMDDQQHALSALVAAPVAFAGDDAEPVGGGERSRGLVWWTLAAVAAGGALRPGRRRWRHVGAAAAGAVTVVVAAGPVLDALDVSPATARMAAGAGAVVAAVGMLAAPSASATAGLVAGGGALLALSAGVDDGFVAVLAVAAAAWVAVLLPARWRGPVVSRLAAAAGLLLGVDLLVDGVLGV